jgi:hypothetical protein
MRLTDFCNCNDFTTRAPARTVRLSRWRRTLFTLPFTSAGAKAPPDDSSGCALDVALPASANSTTRPSSSDAGAGTGCSWLGFPIEETLRRCPFATALSTAREEEERASDAPCRDAARPKPRDTARTASATSSSKEMGFTARSAFPRRVARSVPAFADTSNADPPPDRGFCHPWPASDALSLLATMRKS